MTDKDGFVQVRLKRNGKTVKEMHSGFTCLECSGLGMKPTSRPDVYDFCLTCKGHGHILDNKHDLVQVADW